MRLSNLTLLLFVFLAAAGLSLLAATWSVDLIEETSEIGVREVLDDNGYGWAEVEADGLTVTLAGIAPTEADRFAALSTVASVVDAARIINDMEVAAAAALVSPRFSAEILRNDSGLSVIGLIPAATDRAELLRRLDRIADGVPVTDLIESSDFPVPEGWDSALDFALTAVEVLPRSKVSVDAGAVRVTAISDSADAKAKLERRLERSAPKDVRVSLEIAAPRPVITPFTLRLVKDPDGTRFDACSADTDAARTAILSAALRAGLTGPGDCVVGMGVPSPRWSEAVGQSIAALNALGGGSVTFSDADITLIATEETSEEDFDRIVGELENALPPAFVLFAKLPRPEKAADEGPPEFVATRSPEGLVQLRGRLTDDNLRRVADSYARAAFGSDAVHTAARLAENLPEDWPLRVLTGLEALAQLSNGVVRVTPDAFSVTGTTGNPDAQSRIASLLADKLGEAKQFDIRVTYQEALDPVAALPTPEDCEAEVRAIQETTKINFEPGSATIDTATLGVMEDIAEILRQCEGIRLEIQGHTDSQGREEMNLALSQSRAQSVLNELRARRVLTNTFTAKGYGETAPIADNDSEEGREANRRIEFHLVRPAPMTPEPESTLDSVAKSVESQPEPEGGDGAGD